MTRKIDYNRTKEGDRAEDRKMKLCNTQRDIVYHIYIIGNTVGKAPTQEVGGGCRTATPFQIEIKRHKFNRLEDVKLLTRFNP
jgi:hypothetical protein